MMETKERSAVLIFARSPRTEGAAKRRGPAPPGTAEDLAALLFAHTLDVACRSGYQVVLAADDAGARLAPGGVHVLRQRGADFGERLEHAVADAFAAGIARLVVIGADLPALTAEVLHEAFGRLAAGDERTVVLGPSSDGGYYLIGLNRFEPRAFLGIPWRTRHVLARTRQALQGCRISLLPTLTDADDAGSLRRGLEEVAGPRAGLPSLLWRLLLALDSRTRPARLSPIPPRRAVDLPLLRRGPPVPAA